MTSAQSGYKAGFFKPLNAQLDGEALSVKNMLVNTLNGIKIKIEHDLLNFTLL